MKRNSHYYYLVILYLYLYLWFNLFDFSYIFLGYIKIVELLNIKKTGTQNN